MNISSISYSKEIVLLELPKSTFGESGVVKV